jgi:hypothetical protein
MTFYVVRMHGVSSVGGETPRSGKGSKKVVPRPAERKYYSFEAVI